MSKVTTGGKSTRRRGTRKARGMACCGGQQRRAFWTRSSLDCYLATQTGRCSSATLPPRASSAPDPLLARILQELCTEPDVTTHVIDNPVECGSTTRKHSSEPGPCAVDASPRQELSTVAAKSTSILNTPESPPLLRPCVASTRQNPASTTVCIREGHQPTTTSQRNYDQSRAMPTSIADKQVPKASSHTTSGATAPDDALMRGESDALAASASCLTCLRPYATAHVIAGGARTDTSLHKGASQVSPPGLSRLAQAPTERSAKEWTVESVVRYVESIPGCARHAEKFREEVIDGKALLLLEIEHLIDYMGLPLGPALKILSATRDLREHLN